MHFWFTYYGNFIRFIFYFVLLNFLCNHFVTVSEPKINLNFHKYYTINGIDSSSNIITFYAYYFGNHVALRKDPEKSCYVAYQNRSNSTSCEKDF